MDHEKFLEAYRKAETQGDLDRLVGPLSLQEKKHLRNCMVVVRCSTGLDMRQEFLLDCVLKNMIKVEREEPKDNNEVEMFYCAACSGHFKVGYRNYFTSTSKRCIEICDFCWEEIVVDGTRQAP